MALIIVVEPNALIRMGLLQLLDTLTAGCRTESIDYVQLFRPRSVPEPPELMLLSVPDVYDQTLELLEAAQRLYAPRRILLLSDSDTLPYCLIKMPPQLAGHLSKRSTHDVLAASIMLVLAGGKCFPPPQVGDGPADAVQGIEAGEAGDQAPSARESIQSRIAHDAQDEPPMLCDAVRDSFRELRGAPHHGGSAGSGPRRHAVLLRASPGIPAAASVSALRLAADGAAAPAGELTPELIKREAEILRLTPRQYEVLALLARGLPLKRVSKELSISVATAKTHTEAVYQRLGVNNRNKAVFAAVSQGATLGLYDLHHEHPAPQQANHRG